MTIIYSIYVLLLSLCLGSNTNIDEKFVMCDQIISQSLPQLVQTDIEFINEIQLDDTVASIYYKTDENIIDETGKLVPQKENIVTYIKAYVTIDNQTRAKNYKLIVKGVDVLNIYVDLPTYYVNDALELTLDKGYNRDDYIWSVDSDIATLDEDYILILNEVGTVNVTVKDKKGTVLGLLKLEIKNRPPYLSLNKYEMVTGENVEISVRNYDLDDLVIDYDHNILKYENNKFYAISEGECEIVYSLAHDLDTYAKVNVIVYEKNPILSLDTNIITVDSSAKLTVENYKDSSKYTILYDENIISVKNNFIFPVKAGLTTIKVVLNDDQNVFSTIDIKITNVMPLLVAYANNISINSKTYLMITNLDKLIVNNLDDYTFESLNKDIIKVEDKVVEGDREISVTGLKKGTGTVVCKSNKNSKLIGKCEINVANNDNNLIVSLQHNKQYYKVGEMIDIIVEGGTSSDDYIYSTSTTQLINVLDVGRTITTNEGIGYIVVTSKADKNIQGRIYINIKGQLDINYPDRLIQVAHNELGYKEGANSFTKYGDWYGIPDGDWCAMFVTWCAFYSGIGTEIIPHYASCSAGYRWFESKEKIGLKGEYKPKRGDIIFFLSNGRSHTGIVTGYNNGVVYTIEGNTSDTVAYRQYSEYDPDITGYGIPDYK